MSSQVIFLGTSPMEKFLSGLTRKIVWIILNFSWWDRTCPSPVNYEKLIANLWKINSIKPFNWKGIFEKDLYQASIKKNSTAIVWKIAWAKSIHLFSWALTISNSKKVTPTKKQSYGNGQFVDLALQQTRNKAKFL